jgi:cell division protein FtsW
MPTTTTRPRPASRGSAPPAHARTRPGRPPAERRAADGPAARRTGADGAARVRDRRRPGSSWYLLVAILVILNLVGLVMVLSASSILSIKTYGSPWHFFERQVIWVAIGTVVFVLVSRIEPSRFRRFARPALVVTVLLLLAVLAPGLGRSAGGASRWLGTSSVQIQPSEIAKLALILFAADVLDRRLGERDWRYAMVPVLAAAGIIAALVFKQPDMGTTMVLGAICLGMLITAGLPRKPFLVIMGLAVVGGAIASVAAPYRWARITSFLHPLSNRSDTGYQAANGLAGLSHGGLFGTGIGDSIATWGYLPNAQTDFIFAVIGEETGLVGAVAVTALFAALAVVGVRLACRTRSRFDALIVAGVTTWVVGQAILNIGAVIGILPVTGVPLPFVSFGGTSLVLTMFGVGMVANIARRS